VVDLGSQATWTLANGDVLDFAALDDRLRAEAARLEAAHADLDGLCVLALKVDVPEAQPRKRRAPQAEAARDTAATARRRRS
jgi:hypothetical protein